MPHRQRGQRQDDNNNSPYFCTDQLKITFLLNFGNICLPNKERIGTGGFGLSASVVGLLYVLFIPNGETSISDSIPEKVN